MLKAQAAVVSAKVWQLSLQGFVEFRIGAQPLHLDVEMLNERLKLRGAHRMRTAMRPDEAYGMVFTWCAFAAELKQM